MFVRILLVPTASNFIDSILIWPIEARRRRQKKGRRKEPSLFMTSGSGHGFASVNHLLLQYYHYYYSNPYYKIYINKSAATSFLFLPALRLFVLSHLPSFPSRLFFFFFCSRWQPDFLLFLHNTIRWKSGFLPFSPTARVEFWVSISVQNVAWRAFSSLPSLQISFLPEGPTQFP